MLARWVLSAFRRTPPSPRPCRQPAPLGQLNLECSERLWRLAFPTPQAVIAGRMRARVRDNIVGILETDTLEPRCFPRRPALMPQLMQAVNDPHADTDRVSRIIAHDPVLTADVLRLANSTFYRRRSAPIESIQRAVVVCGAQSIRGMAAAAMLRPAFRATRKNFPRFPRMLWERTELASRAAELYACTLEPADRFAAQMAVLLSALGPLVVYGAALDVYARNPQIEPDGTLCMELIREFAPQMSRRIAQDWMMAERLLAAIMHSPGESLATALEVGELLGTLALLERQSVIGAIERRALIDAAALPEEAARRIWTGLMGVTP